MDPGDPSGPLGNIGRTLLIAGLALAAIGALMMFGSRLPWLGRLPGDIHLRGKNWSFHFPIVTSIVVSIVLTILWNLFSRK
jgi:Zn-dependent protease with chaperone function